MFKPKKKQEDRVEQLLDTIRELVRDLPRADYKRLKEAMDLMFEAYQKAKAVKTQAEKEVEEVDAAEKYLEQ